MSDNPIFSYTKRDYDSSRKEGLSQIPTLSRGTWTDLNATDPGIIMLDYVHALVDMVQFYQDHQALETFLPTAKERANLFRLAKQYAYQIRSSSAAEVYVKFYTNFLYDNPIKIPKGTEVSTSTGINFITAEDAYIKSGESNVEVMCIQGQFMTKTYEGTGVSRYSNIEYPANQEINLTATNIDTNYIEIVDNLGRKWERVNSIIFSTESDRVYEVELNPDDSVTIKFGDGERGVVPQETDTLTVTYLLTDAENGRVGANTIEVMKSEIVDSEGKYIPIVVRNESPSVGGSAPQSSTSIRDLAPGAIKAQGRAVTIRDFENLAKLVDGVSSAKAYDVNNNPDIPYHEVRVIIIPESYGDNNSNRLLVRKVYDYLYQRMIPPTNLRVATPSSISVDIGVEVRSIGDVDKGYLEYTLTETIKDYFDKLSREIGEDFYPADLSAVINRVDGVKYVVSVTPTKIVEISDMAVATLGELSIRID